MTYSYQKLEKDLKSQKILSIVLLSIIVLLAITATILFIVFATYFNRVLFTVLLCTIDSVLVICMFLTYDFMFLPTLKTEKHIKTLKQDEAIEVVGKLIEISEKPTTVADSLGYYKLTFEYEGESKIHYYHYLLEMNFEVGKTYRLKVVDNFILEYEESEND